jgi:hypothetical protein
VGTRSAATGRVAETFVATAAGLVAGFVLTSPRVQPAEEAIEELCGTMAGLLDRMAAGLRDGPVQAGAASGWLGQARALGREIRRVDDARRQAEESTKLNPRSLRLPYSTITLRGAWRPWNTRRSRSASSPARWPTAPGWQTRTIPSAIRTRAAGWPTCWPNWPPRSGRTAAWPPSSTRLATNGYGPGWSGA